MFVENVLDGWVADFDPFQCQNVTQSVTTPGGMLQADRQDLFHMLRRRGQRVAFRDGWKVFQPLNPVRLKAPLVFVKLRPRYPPLPTGLTDVPKRFR